jgi:hypothetical protein
MDKKRRRNRRDYNISAIAAARRNRRPIDLMSQPSAGASAPATVSPISRLAETLLRAQKQRFASVNDTSGTGRYSAASGQKGRRAAQMKTPDQ